MMKKKIVKYAAVALGLLLLGLGGWLLRMGDWEGVLPYLCIGVGSGLFGHGMSYVISERTLRNDPALKKKLDIETNDERNIAIAHRAKAKAFDMMSFVFGALLLALGLMKVDMVAVLLLFAAYIFVHGVAAYYRIKFDKEM